MPGGEGTKQMTLDTWGFDQVGSIKATADLPDHDGLLECYGTQ